LNSLHFTGNQIVQGPKDRFSAYMEKILKSLSKTLIYFRLSSWMTWVSKLSAKVSKS